MLLVSCPKKSLPRPISMSFFSTFSSCNFILSTLMFESCIHFKLIGGHGVIYRSNFTVLYMNIYLPFSATFVEETIHSSLGILASLTKHSVQFSRLVVSNSLQTHGLQHARPPCPSPAPKSCSNSCPSSQWHHPAISSSALPFSSCLQSFPASGSFPMSQFFA